MPKFPVEESRRWNREIGRKRASLVIDEGSQLKRIPCLVIDSSREGLRLRGSFQLRRGQVVEVVLDENPSAAARCRVVWVGKAGSKLEGEAGLKCV
ncbi:MAG: PilZ domain-containing protein [Candidatus Acidiferrum sp.]